MEAILLFIHQPFPTCWGKLALRICCTTALQSLVLYDAWLYQVSEIKWREIKKCHYFSITSKSGGKTDTLTWTLLQPFPHALNHLSAAGEISCFCHSEKGAALYVPLAHRNMPRQEGLTLVSTGKGDQPWDFTREQQTKNVRIESGKYCCNLSFVSVHLGVSFFPRRTRQMRLKTKGGLGAGFFTALEMWNSICLMSPGSEAFWDAPLPVFPHATFSDSTLCGLRSKR